MGSFSHCRPASAPLGPHNRQRIVLRFQSRLSDLWREIERLLCLSASSRNGHAAECHERLMMGNELATRKPTVVNGSCASETVVHPGICAALANSARPPLFSKCPFLLLISPCVLQQAGRTSIEVNYLKCLGSPRGKVAMGCCAIVLF